MCNGLKLYCSGCRCSKHLSSYSSFSKLRWTFKPISMNYEFNYRCRTPNMEICGNLALQLLNSKNFKKYRSETKITYIISIEFFYSLKTMFMRREITEILVKLVAIVGPDSRYGKT